VQAARADVVQQPVGLLRRRSHRGHGVVGEGQVNALRGKQGLRRGVRWGGGGGGKKGVLEGFGGCVEQTRDLEGL
jgi:hypothetical protein